MTTFNFNFSIFQKLQLKVIAFAANTRNFCHFLKNLWLVTLEEKKVWAVCQGDVHRLTLLCNTRH